MAVDQGRFRLETRAWLDMEQEFSCSARNQLSLLYDSKRFEPEDTETFDIVSRLIRQQDNASVPPKDRPTLRGEEPFERCRSCEPNATRLCAEMARAAGAYIRGRGREIAQARFRPITTKAGRISMNHGICPSRGYPSTYDMLVSKYQ